MNTQSITSNIPTTPMYMERAAEKLEERILGSEDIVDTTSRDRFETRSPNEEIEQPASPAKKKFSLGKTILRTAMGCAIGASAIALSGGGVLATAALGAAIWGVTGAAVGGVIGGVSGKLINKTAPVALFGAATGGVTGVVSGALKGAIIGGLAGIFGSTPLAGAAVGGVLSALRI
jgi:hypothetical protein